MTRRWVKLVFSKDEKRASHFRRKNLERSKVRSLCVRDTFDDGALVAWQRRFGEREDPSLSLPLGHPFLPPTGFIPSRHSTHRQVAGATLIGPWQSSTLPRGRVGARKASFSEKRESPPWRPLNSARVLLREMFAARALRNYDLPVDSRREKSSQSAAHNRSERVAVRAVRRAQTISPGVYNG